MSDLRTPRTAAMWDAYVAARPSAAGPYDVVALGDTPEMATRLAALVTHGPKRATAGNLRAFEEGGEQMPKEGDHVLLVDGAGDPVAVWRTTDVKVKPLDQVTDRFAWDEGEGDRSRAYWLDAHQRFFRREAQANGWPYDDAMPTVFERFAVVWPPDIADPAP
jgi:uncharacterized protein YhfF